MDPRRIEKLERDVTRLLQHFHGVGGDQTSTPIYYPDKPKMQILITLIDSNQIIRRQCLTIPLKDAIEVYEGIKGFSGAKMTDGNIKL